jgi:hypothetical protein
VLRVKYMKKKMVPDLKQTRPNFNYFPLILEIQLRMF